MAPSNWNHLKRVYLLWYRQRIVKMKVLVTWSCPTLCHPMDYDLPVSSVRGILQARILEWVASPFSRDLPDPGIEPGSPALHTDSLPFEPPGKLSVREPQWEAWWPGASNNWGAVTTSRPEGTEEKAVTRTQGRAFGRRAVAVHHQVLPACGGSQGCKYLSLLLPVIHRLFSE